jgi:hypothetical protein
MPSMFFLALGFSKYNVIVVNSLKLIGYYIYSLFWYTRTRTLHSATQCICVFHVVLRISSRFSPKQN